MYTSVKHFTNKIQIAVTDKLFQIKNRANKNIPDDIIFEIKIKYTLRRE